MPLLSVNDKPNTTKSSSHDITLADGNDHFWRFWLMLCKNIIIQHHVMKMAISWRFLTFFELLIVSQKYHCYTKLKMFFIDFSMRYLIGAILEVHLITIINPRSTRIHGWTTFVLRENIQRANICFFITFQPINIFTLFFL